MDAFNGGLERPFSRLSDRIGGGAIAQSMIVNPAQTTIAVPADAAWCLMEAVGPGGNAIGTDARGGGGAGSDAILPVVPRETLTLNLSSPVNSAATTIARGSTILLTANAGANGVNGVGASASGKYPGGSPTGTGNVGRGGSGGGRLGGVGGVARGGINEAPLPGTNGGGAAVNVSGGAATGALGAICLTFFAAYDDALAFAKSLYGGTWTP